MRIKKIKGLVLLAIILCINSVPVLAYSKDNNTGVEIRQEDSIEIESNWLTREVAEQLDKKYSDLTEADFLKIKKIDFRYKRIEDKLPEEIGLLKNLEYLDLNYCRLYGEIPESLGNLNKLKYLDLGDNKFENLPKAIENKIENGYLEYCDVELNNFKLNKGWNYLKGNWCYIDESGNRLKGIQTIDDKEYNFDEEGNTKFGWITNDGNKYYCDRLDGVIKNAWKNIAGKWYYFNEEGIMQTGLQTIKGVKFYLNENGEMATGWKVINNEKYYFTGTDGMKYGWLVEGNNTYYLDESTGKMVAGEEKVIGGKRYKFYAEGILIKDIWIDSNTYAQANGEIVNIDSNFSHSSSNLELFKYMTYSNNRISVDNAAVKLHDGDLSNNCVYFLSEALRRVGFSIPLSMCNTYAFENELKNQGFVYSYDLTQLKPGDIVFTNNYTHVYIFMGWDTDGYAYIVDNQSYNYGGKILHKRNVFSDTATTDRATHFYYYQY